MKWFLQDSITFLKRFATLIFSWSLVLAWPAIGWSHPIAFWVNSATDNGMPMSSRVDFISHPFLPISLCAILDMTFESSGSSAPAIFVVFSNPRFQLSTYFLSAGSVTRREIVSLCSGIRGFTPARLLCLPTTARRHNVSAVGLGLVFTLAKTPIGRTAACVAACFAIASHSSNGYSHSSAVANSHPSWYFTPQGRCSCDSSHHTFFMSGIV